MAPILKTLPRVVKRFRIRGGLVVRRYGATSKDQFGNLTAPAVSEFRVDPIVAYPAAGRTVLLLPEAERTLASLDVFTLQELRPSIGGAGVKADVILYKVPGIEGVQPYRISVSAPWADYNGAYRYLAVREENP